MFFQSVLDFDTNLFDELLSATNFETITRDREGAILVNKLDIIPLVRSTTIYKNPPQLLSSIHHDIINKIKSTYATHISDIDFNNIMIEIYDNTYTKMKYHSDITLDLDPCSYICIYSCYSNPESKSVRKLIVKSKEDDSEYEYILHHNSIILFSVETNKKFTHKIILDKPSRDNNKWLGMTLRLSKTFIHFINEEAYFYNTDIKLKEANIEERKQFYKMKGDENHIIEFSYDFIDYTISQSDLIKLN